MHTTNYVRDIRSQYTDAILNRALIAEPKYGQATVLALEAIARAQKFMLPLDGKILDDNLKGLSGMPRLPFPAIVLEYPARCGAHGDDNHTPYSKTAVLAMEEGDKIMVMSFSYIHPKGRPRHWMLLPEAAWLAPAKEGVFIVNKDEPREHILTNVHVQMVSLVGPQNELTMYEDMQPDIRAVLELCEALSCANVGTTTLPVQKLNKSAQRRGALPFDEYKILTITTKGTTTGVHSGGGGDRRKPREHLRRGHIRICASGIKTWVQSCVVSAGTAGKIIHDYEVTT